MTNAKQPTVSVIIPSHNRPELVANAVESVLEQGQPTEIIVIDDGSTPALPEAGPLGDPSVRLLRNDVAQGPTRARNLGIDLATGEYVAFLDDDDVWLPGKLAACIDATQSGPEGAVVVHRTADGAAPVHHEPKRPPEPMADPVRFYGRNQIPHLNSVFIDTALAKEVRFDESFGAAEDVDFVFNLAKLRPFVLIPEVYAVRRVDTNSKIGLQARIAAREQLRSKHPDVVDVDPESRAFYHVRLGHLHLAAGSRRRALGSFTTALRHLVTYRRAWNGIVATVLPRQALPKLSSWSRSRGGSGG